MNTFRRFLLLSAALAAITSAQAQTPYLETAPISILWNFTHTGITGTTIGLPPTLPDATGPFNPGALRPVERITTEAGSVITYFTTNGHQQFFVDKIIINLINGYKAEAARLTAEAEALPEDSPERGDLLALAAFYLARVEYLEEHREGRWELTAVRVAQSTLEGALNTPFQIFLSRIEPTAGRPSRNFQTNLLVQPIASTANTTETLYAGPATDAVEVGRVTKATGNATIHLRLEFECDDTDAQEYWLLFGTAYLTCNIRSTPGPLAAVVLTKPSITGHGTWWHAGPAFSYRGISPIAIKMGEAKYQHKGMFPDFVEE